VYTDLALAYVHIAEGRLGLSQRLREAALALARRLGNPDALFFSGWLVLGATVPRRCQEDLDLAEELIRLPRAGVRPVMLGRCLWYCALRLLEEGERTRAERLWQEVAEHIERTRDATLGLLTPLRDVILATIDGRLADVAALEAVLERRTDEAGGGTGGRIAFGRARAPIYLGHYAEVERIAGQFPDPFGTISLFSQAYAHPTESLRTELRRIVAALKADEYPDQIPSFNIVPVLETALQLRDPDSAAWLAQSLAPLASCACDGQHLVSIARLLGGAAALLGDVEQATAYYERALHQCSEIDFRPELALIHLELAELLAGGGPEARAAAAPHLAVATPELEAMQMAPALGRVQALRQTLGDGGQTAEEPPPSDEGAPTAGVGAVAPRKVFISYASGDRARAAALAETLEVAGVVVWLDKRSIAGGSSWDAEIVRGIKASSVVAVLVSPLSVRSSNVQQELRLALQYRKPLLPLLLEPTEYPEEVEYALAGRQRIELLERPEGEWLPWVLQALDRLR
jgi:tetratricopeptide (TPR) repeat protein